MSSEPSSRPASIRPKDLTDSVHSAGSHHTSVANLKDAVHTGDDWATRVDNAWDPLILTLDGGGIRGYSTLLIIQELMNQIAFFERQFDGNTEANKDRYDPSTLKPCHYFDYMYGTSTGGLIATMLGRLRMNVAQCLDVYRRVGDDLFGSKRSSIPLSTKYHHKPLEEAVRQIVKENCPVHENGQCDGEDWHPWLMSDMKSAESSPLSASQDMREQSLQLPAPGVCQSICLSATHNGKVTEAYLLRTYSHHYVRVPNWITLYNSGADPLRIWQVTRATSAAPFYFAALTASIREDSDPKTFMDGGIRENNPSGAAWSEFISLYGENKNPALLLSIGTGRPDESRDGFAAAWPYPLGSFPMVQKAASKFAVFKNVLIKYTEGERQHRAMVDVARGEHSWYKRLNVSTGLQKMRLDHWERGKWKNTAGEEKEVPGGTTLTMMEAATKAYLDVDTVEGYAAPKLKIRQTAEKLVRHRRARERMKHADGEERWERYLGRYLADDCSRDEERHGLVDSEEGSYSTIKADSPSESNGRSEE